MLEGGSVAGRGERDSAVVAAGCTCILGICFANHRSFRLPSRANDLKIVAALQNAEGDSQHCPLARISLLIVQAVVLRAV